MLPETASRDSRVIPSEAPRSVATVTLLSDGVEVPRSYHLLSAVVSREVARIPWARLVLRDGSAADESFELSDSDFFVPGKTIEIRSGYRGEVDPIYKGVVIRHNIKLRRDGSLLIIECRHKATAMTVAPKSRYFTEVTDSDVFETLLGEYSLTADVASTTVTHPALVQYEATDWDFMLCRAEANGMLCIVNDDGLKLQRPDLSGTASLTIRHGATMHDLDAEIDQRLQWAEVKTSSWNPMDKEREETEAREPGLSEIGNLSASTLASAVREQNISSAHDGYLQSPELQQWADATLLRHRLGKIRGKVRTDGTADVQVGGYVRLAGVGERFEGSHFVSGVRHQIENGVWETIIQFGLDPEPFTKTFDVQQPLAGGLLPPVQGVHIGIVTDIVDPDGIYRVKVRVSLIHEGEEGTWARLGAIYAGDNRGFYSLPEVDDEVLVSFLNNDPRHAVVLGSLYNGRATPPITAATANNEKGFVSRNNLKFIFNDQQGQESVKIETPGGSSIVIKDGPSSIEVKDANGNTVKLEAAGVTITAAAKITLQGAQVEISAGQLTVSAGMAQFSGVVQAQTVIAPSIVGSSYTPGAGNIM